MFAHNIAFQNIIVFVKYNNLKNFENLKIKAFLITYRV